MNVSSILRRKGTHVETARPTTTVGEAARRLNEKGVGSLVILDEANELFGVLSERDLIAAIAEFGPSACDVPIGEIALQPPTTCHPEDSLTHAMSIMTRRRARHVPVVAGEAVVGIISVGDVVKGQLVDLELEVSVLRDYARIRA